MMEFESGSIRAIIGVAARSTGVSKNMDEGLLPLSSELVGSIPSCLDLFRISLVADIAGYTKSPLRSPISLSHWALAALMAEWPLSCSAFP